MDFKRLVGKTIIWTKKKDLSTEKGVIESVKGDAHLVACKMEDAKMHFFAFSSFKENGGVVIEEKTVFDEFRSEILAEEQEMRKQAEEAQKAKEARKAQELALAEAAKLAAKKKKAKRTKKK
jgi:hypothetical protein